jgi:hypothetical protein
MAIELFIMALSLVLGALALPIAAYALIKVLALEKSTHKIEFVSPERFLTGDSPMPTMPGLTDEEMTRGIDQGDELTPEQAEKELKKTLLEFERAGLSS